MYGRGHGGPNGVPQDDNKAYRYAVMAAEGGDERSCLSIGLALDRGIGVEQDKTKAVEYFKRAADQVMTGQKSKLEKGARVYLGGLKGRLELNGRKATCVRKLESGRWSVRVKLSNMSPCSSPGGIAW